MERADKVEGGMADQHYHSEHLAFEFSVSTMHIALERTSSIFNLTYSSLHRPLKNYLIFIVIFDHFIFSIIELPQN